MSNPTPEELKARIAELETELANRPAQPVAAGPTNPHAGPVRNFCIVCGTAHQPGQHSHCLVCHRPYGLLFPSQVETEPCGTCGSKGYVHRSRPAPIPIPKMPRYHG